MAQLRADHGDTILYPLCHQNLWCQPLKHELGLGTALCEQCNADSHAKIVVLVGQVLVYDLYAS